jgi:hypothetical protein
MWSSLGEWPYCQIQVMIGINPNSQVHVSPVLADVLGTFLMVCGIADAATPLPLVFLARITIHW